MEKFHVKTLGCKVNSFDSHALENQLRSFGWIAVESPSEADVSIVNTCSVTQNADKEARYLARRFKREQPEALVVMVGCYAQTDSAKLATMPEVDLIVPNEVKDQTATFVRSQLAAKRQGQLLERMPPGVKTVDSNKQSHFKSSITLFDHADSSQTRAFVKIQDGCNGFCTYCLIPYARGASRSVPEQEALGEIRRLVSLGTREIVLTGIHIGDFGVDHLAAGAAHDSEPFAEFMKKVFDIPDLTRVRISSLEPAELTESLIKVLYEHRTRFCDHFHLPLQSGSDAILKKMRRTYDKQRYRASCDMARAYFPDVCLGADVIPGFPGETEDQFAETVRFINDCGLSYLHVFPYSARPNTAAIKMPGHLDAGLIKVRAAKLRQLSNELRLTYNSRFIGRRVSVLWEKDTDEQGRACGTTCNYLNVAAAKRSELTRPGSVSEVVLKGFTAGERMLGIFAD